MTSATGPSEWDNRRYVGGEGRGTAGVKVIVVSGATHLSTVGESAVFTQPRPHECGPDPDRSADTLGQDKTLVPEDNLTKLTSNPGPDWTDIVYV